jgi:hypothetical protein
VVGVTAGAPPQIHQDGVLDTCRVIVEETLLRFPGASIHSRAIRL